MHKPPFEKHDAWQLSAAELHAISTGLTHLQRHGYPFGFLQFNHTHLEILRVQLSHGYIPSSGAEKDALVAALAQLIRYGHTSLGDHMLDTSDIFTLSKRFWHQNTNQSRMEHLFCCLTPIKTPNHSKTVGLSQNQTQGKRNRW